MNFSRKLFFSFFSFAVALSVDAASNLKFLIPNYADHVVLAPDGKNLVVVEHPNSGDVVLRFSDTDSFKVDLTHVSDGKGGNAPVREIFWISNEVVAITSQLDSGNGLYTFKLGDKYPTRLAKEGARSLIAKIMGTNRFVVKETSGDDEPEYARLVEYDALLGEESAKVIYEVESKTLDAFFDSEGKLRLVKKPSADGSGDAWFRIEESGGESQLSGLSQWSTVFGVHGSSNQVLAAGNIDGDVSSIVAYNIEKDSVEQTLTDNDVYSLDQLGEIVFDDKSGRVAGLFIDGIEPRSFWLDSSYEAIQTEVDGILVGSANRIVGLSSDRETVLVERSFPMLPTQFCIVKPSTKKLNVVVHGGGQVLPEEVGATRLVQVPNRDGVNIPVILTLPAGFSGEKTPVIVWIRKEVWSGLDQLEWSPEANYFAASGYVVLRINYRGTEGLLGDLQADINTKEGVSKMFRDIEDVVDAFAAAGVADAEKIAIGGEGAGGWAASYAAKASPERYRAVICLNGVYDLEAALDEKTGYNATSGVNLGFASSWSGMPREDVLSFQTVSGVESYPEFVFISYGKWSPGEYINQTNRFVKTLKKAGTTVKPYSEDWYGAGLSGKKRFGVFDRLPSFLKSAFK